MNPTRQTLLAVAGAAVLAAPAGAHTFATPGFLRENDPTAVEIAVHNDRRIAMSQVTVEVPEGLEVRGVDEVSGWEAEESPATWSGGSLPGGQAQSFGLTLEAEREPGSVALTVEQRYPDGAVVQSPVALTVVPGFSSSTPWGIVGGVLLVVVAGVALAAVFAYRRLRSAPGT
jgi:hypothetical protein